MTTFRDAIQAAFDYTSDPTHDAYIGDADAVLNMPEMQDVRRVLRQLARTVGLGEGLGITDTLEAHHLPEHVIAWVIDEPKP